MKASGFVMGSLRRDRTQSQRPEPAVAILDARLLRPKVGSVIPRSLDSVELLREPKVLSQKNHHNSCTVLKPSHPKPYLRPASLADA